MKTLIIDYNGPIIDANNFFENRSRRIAYIFKSKWSKKFQNEWTKLYLEATAGKISAKSYYKSISDFLNKKLEGNEDKKFIQREKLADNKVPFHLNNLRKKFGYRLKIGLLSNYMAAWIKPVLHKYKLHSYFDAIVVSDKIKIRKPDVMAYLIIAKRLHVAPKECIYVGDEVDDLEGAESAGMIPVFIPGEQDKTKKFPTINDIGEVAKFLT